jgi:hypothetical protein
VYEVREGRSRRGLAGKGLLFRKDRQGPARLQYTPAKGISTQVRQMRAVGSELGVREPASWKAQVIESGRLQQRARLLMPKGGRERTKELSPYRR